MLRDALFLRLAVMKPVPKVKCPTCKKEGAWFAGPYGPFCSHRCKLIDLGKWFSQENAISEPLRPEHLEKYGRLAVGRTLDARRRTTGIKQRSHNFRAQDSQYRLDKSARK